MGGARAGVAGAVGGVGLTGTDALLAAAMRLAEAALAPSTRRSYATMWSDFAAFCGTAGVPALPATREVLGRWLASRAASGRGAGSSRALAAVRARHLELGFEDPVRDAWLQRVVAGAERMAAVDRPEREVRAPLPVAVVGRLLAVVPSWVGLRPLQSAYAGATTAQILAVRDAAVLAVGLRLMRRAGELAALEVSDVRLLPDGTTAVWIRRSKTDQLGAGLLLPLDATGGLTCPVALLARWLAVRPALLVRGAQTEALFVTATGRPLSRPAISSLVARAASSTGFAGKFSGHSMRIGGATAAVSAGASMATVKAVGGWSSNAVRRYIRPFGTDLSSLMGFGEPVGRVP